MGQAASVTVTPLTSVAEDTVILFPLSRCRAANPGLVSLLRSTRRLEAALDFQAQQVARWRCALDDLHGSVSGLGDSLVAYGDALRRIDVAPIGRASRELVSSLERAADH
jgi:hypothetical protein